MKVLILEDKHPAVLCPKSMASEIDPGIAMIDVPDSVNEAVKWVARHTHPDLKKMMIRGPGIFFKGYGNNALMAFQIYCIDYLFLPIEKKDLAPPGNKNESFTGFSQHIKQPASLSFLT